MELNHITYSGPQFEEDSSLISALPQNLVSLLKQINGFVQFHGGLHVRGVCVTPSWHSLESAMSGSIALHRLYPVLTTSDIPFAQDCVADQFILRDSIVHKLEAETGTLESLGVGLGSFFSAIHENPIEYLTMQPLLQFQNEGGSLQPGQVLQVYPPFCTVQAGAGVRLSPISAQEAIVFLADFARQIIDIPTGGKFNIKITP
ncbi:MAG TPA: hypothetical protein VIF82_01935 [Burkholderiaceae bacterium]|jgi:hypothetical protein